MLVFQHKTHLRAHMVKLNTHARIHARTHARTHALTHAQTHTYRDCVKKTLSTEQRNMSAKLILVYVRNECTIRFCIK